MPVAVPPFTDLAFAAFRDDDPLMRFLGKIGVAEIAGGLAFKVDLGQGATNPGGSLHGGALAALFDVALYEAARIGWQAPAATISLDVKFLKAGDLAAPLYVAADVLRAGRMLATCLGSAFQHGELIAHASGQFARR